MITVPSTATLVRRRTGYVNGAMTVYELEIHADRFESVEGVVSFYVGPHCVARSSQLVDVPQLIA